MRAKLGKFGLSGHHHLTPICKLSGGQKARVVFTSISLAQPHILLLDEPTNHLDMQVGVGVRRYGEMDILPLLLCALANHLDTQIGMCVCVGGGGAAHILHVKVLYASHTSPSKAKSKHTGL